MGKGSNEGHSFIRKATSRHPSICLLYRKEVEGRAGTAGVGPILQNISVQDGSEIIYKHPCIYYTKVTFYNIQAQEGPANQI